MCGKNLKRTFFGVPEKHLFEFRFLLIISVCVILLQAAPPVDTFAHVKGVEALQQKKHSHPENNHSKLFFTFNKKPKTVAADKVTKGEPAAPKPRGSVLFANAAAKTRAAAGRILSVSGFTAIIKKHGGRLFFLAVSLFIICSAVAMYRQKYESKRFMTTTRLSIMDKEVQRTCRYIEDNFSDPKLGLSSICADLVTGEAFLEALFQKELGLTTGEFINQVRINRAKIMLRQSAGKEPAVIAEAVGYEGKDEFLKSFSRITGVDYGTYCASLTDGVRG